MAVGFRRRLAALTVRKASSSYLRLKELSCSASLPAGLHDSANALLEWNEAPAPEQACMTWVGDGVDHLIRLLAALTELLHHPQLHDPCKKASPWMERLLCDLVLLADAHGCFCKVLLSLKQLLVETQSAVRHGDAARLAAAFRARHRSDRALTHLASTLRALNNRSSSSGEDVLAEAVTSVAAAASTAIFARLASASDSSVLQALTSPTAASPAKTMERLRSLEECVVATEDGCQQVQRALVNTRVSLLNLLSADLFASVHLSQ